MWMQAADRPLGARTRGLAPLARTLRAWLAKARGRRELAALDDRLLRDIGVTAAEARRESVVPFWR